MNPCFRLTSPSVVRTEAAEEAVSAAAVVAVVTEAAAAVEEVTGAAAMVEAAEAVAAMEVTIEVLSPKPKMKMGIYNILKVCRLKCPYSAFDINNKDPTRELFHKLASKARSGLFA